MYVVFGNPITVVLEKETFKAGKLQIPQEFSTNWGSFFVGVLIIRARLFGVCMRAPNFLNLPCLTSSVLKSEEFRESTSQSGAVFRDASEGRPSMGHPQHPYGNTFSLALPRPVPHSPSPLPAPTADAPELRRMLDVIEKEAETAS